VKLCSYKTATTCNRKLFRKLLRSGYTGARPRYSRTVTGLGRTYELMQGSLDKELFRRSGCFLGQDGLPPRPRPPSNSSTREIRLGNATFRAFCPQARHLLHLSAGWREDSPAGAPAKQLEVRRSTLHRFRVNSFRGPTLSPELCSRFLIELAPPVNIAYGRQIMSRD
jgi:hypothetical protein